MKVHSEELSEEFYSEDRILAAQIVSKLLIFSKKYLNIDSSADVDFVSKIKENAKFYSIPLPLELSEGFLFYEHAPYFLILESPVISYLHKLFNINHSSSYGENPQRHLKEFYAKWVESKIDSDTKYFATSMINQLEKTKNNAYNMILHSFILGFDDRLFNPEKSVQLLNTASDLIFDKNLEKDYLNELKYLLKLFEGFLFLKRTDFAQANKLFYEALDTKNYGISAKFHLALTEIQLDNSRVAIDIVEEIYNFDIARLNFAIKNNSLTIFEYFLKNSVCKYFFFEPKFFPVLFFFEDKIEAFKSHNLSAISELKMNLLNFREVKLKKYYTVEIESNLRFLEKYIKHFKGNESILISDSVDFVNEKFDHIIELITTSIREKYYCDFSEQLTIYNNKIEEVKREKIHSSEDLEIYRGKMNENLRKNLESYESEMSGKIAAYEDKIKNLDFRQDLDPSTSFKNSFTYTAMLSFMVLLIGGFSSYSNSYVDDMAEFSNVITIILTHGAKWGLITFLIGFMISIGVAIYAMMEKTSVKQRMVKKVSNLVDDKERGKEQLRKDISVMIKDMEEKTRQRIIMLEREIDELSERRKKEDERLKSEAEERINHDLKKLQDFQAE